MFADLLNSSYFALFLIVALGFMLGKIKIKGLSLDVSAVIFIALLFGHFGVVIPKELGNFGIGNFLSLPSVFRPAPEFSTFVPKQREDPIDNYDCAIICFGFLQCSGSKYLYSRQLDRPRCGGLAICWCERY